MISRAWMLLAAALVSPAWSQEAAAVPPKVTPQSFDLHSASMQKLVRDTAATQYAPVLRVEDEPAKQQTPARLASMRAAALAPSPPPAPRWFRILSEAVGEILEPDEDHEFDAQYAARNACLKENRDRPTDQRNWYCQQTR